MTKCNSNKIDSNTNVMKPVSVEPTHDELAAVVTTIVKLPGENQAPNQIAAASTLVSIKHSPHLMLKLVSSQPNKRHVGQTT